MRSALALAALAALLVRSAADAGDVLVSPDVLARASSALRGALRQVGALLAEHAHPECQRTPVSSSGGGSNGSYPQAFSHIYPNTTNVYRYARSRRDNKDTTYLGSFLKLEVLAQFSASCLICASSDYVGMPAYAVPLQTPITVAK